MVKIMKIKETSKSDFREFIYKLLRKRSKKFLNKTNTNKQLKTRHFFYTSGSLFALTSSQQQRVSKPIPYNSELNLPLSYPQVLAVLSCFKKKIRSKNNFAAIILTTICEDVQINELKVIKKSRYLEIMIPVFETLIND